MLAPRFDAPVRSTCVSKSSGSVLISGDGTGSICLSTPLCCCSGKCCATSHSLGSPGDTGTIGCIGSTSKSSDSSLSCLF